MAVEKNLYTGSSTSVLYTDRRDFYVDNAVKELWTDDAPFLTLASNLNQFKPKDPIFKLWEHRNPWVEQRFQVQSGTLQANGEEDAVALPASTSTNTIGLGFGSNGSLRGSFYVGLECAIHSNDPDTGKPKGERKGVVLITTYTGDTSIGVKLIAPVTNPVTSYTIVDGDWFVVVGNAHGEGSSSPEGWADELKTVWGSCQIFRTSFQVTKTLMNAQLRGESNEYLRLRKLKGSEHKIQKERAFIFGKTVMGNNLNGGETFGDTTWTDAGTEKVRTTNGILEAILTYGATSGDNQAIFSIPEATYKYSNFVDDMEKVFQYYPEDGIKIMLCGHGMLSYWSKLEGQGGSGFGAKSGWTVKIGEISRDKLGFNYRILETPHGLIQLVPTPSLTRSPYNKTGIIISKQNISHAVYERPEYHQNIKTDNAPLYQKDEYYSYEGLGFSLIESFKYFKLV